MAARLRNVAADSVPGSSSVGIVHRDLWPRNVVIDKHGTPWIVDNGNVAYGAHEFDLARTDYLWPMDAAARESFRTGYSETGPTLSPDSAFWKIDVLTEVALFRATHRVRGLARPMGRLRLLAA
jgi:fructosamine-3-kinase